VNRYKSIVTKSHIVTTKISGENATKLPLEKTKIPLETTENAFKTAFVFLLVKNK
jgi:hypothetical protein